MILTLLIISPLLSTKLSLSPKIPAQPKLITENPKSSVPTPHWSPKLPRRRLSKLHLLPIDVLPDLCNNTIIYTDCKVLYRSTRYYYLLNITTPATCYNYKLLKQNTKRRKQEHQKETQDTFKLLSYGYRSSKKKGKGNTKQNKASKQPKETTKLGIIHLFTFKTIIFQDIQDLLYICLTKSC